MTRVNYETLGKFIDVDEKEAVNVAEIKNHDIILSVPKTEWKAGLKNAMEYYIKKEEYEECSKIKKLIEKL